MVREVVEVVARFGGTIIGVTHVGPTGTYRIGTAPGIELAVPGLTCFPLVAGRIVRCPVGMHAEERDGTTELRVGALSLHVTRTTLAPVALPRPRVQLRTPLFVLASLLVHLVVRFTAERFAPLERLSFKPAVRLARLVESPPPVPEREPAPREQASAKTAQPAREASVARSAQIASARYAEPVAGMASSAAATSARLARSFDDTRVEERVGELTAEDLYNEDDANGQGFGGGRRFDPSQREGYGTVETGAYATLAYDVRLCPKKSCQVVGPIPALYVRTHLHAHMDAIYDCYRMHASEPGTIILEFTITGDGAVRDARGSGLGETGACAARVAGEIFFKALERETRVRYPVQFN